MAYIPNGLSTCDSTCESKGNAALREAMRPSPPRHRFPIPSHRINVLTPILSPCVAGCCLSVERAMGIETTRTMAPELEIKRFGVAAPPKCDYRVNFSGMRGGCVRQRRDTSCAKSPARAKVPKGL